MELRLLHADDAAEQDLGRPSHAHESVRLHFGQGDDFIHLVQYIRQLEFFNDPSFRERVFGRSFKRNQPHRLFAADSGDPAFFRRFQCAGYSRRVADHRFGAERLDLANHGPQNLRVGRDGAFHRHSFQQIRFQQYPVARLHELFQSAQQG